MCKSSHSIVRPEKPYLCHCACHNPRMAMRIEQPCQCCEVCPDCGERIVKGMMQLHEAQCGKRAALYQKQVLGIKASPFRPAVPILPDHAPQGIPDDEEVVFNPLTHLVHPA